MQISSKMKVLGDNDNVDEMHHMDVKFPQKLCFVVIKTNTNPHL